MNDSVYYAERDDRLLRYPEARRLDQSRWITIRAARDYVNTYAGQVAVLVAANLFGRMARLVALDVPDVPMVVPLPWAGQNLATFAVEQMQAGDPRGAFCLRAATNGDHVVDLGPSAGPVVTHGTGWFAYHGAGPSPLPDDGSPNPIGAALAVIAAAAHVAVHGFESQPAPVCLNAFNWTHDIGSAGMPEVPSAPSLGSVWTVGTGSVGTAILYFLTLATRNASVVLFDGDKVKRENITRSPIFAERHIGAAKVDVTEAYLKACGVAGVKAEAMPLHESRTWSIRPAGTPDLVIAAANEHNVRHLIETLFPPLQIYGTTGRNWQASMIRHIPLRDPCSCCLFPEAAYASTQCATDEGVAADGEPRIDASLPFLSFAAGLMAAAEILKLQLPGYPPTANRVCLMTRPEMRLVRARTTRRQGCGCGPRSGRVHAQMIAGSRYSALST